MVLVLQVEILLMISESKFTSLGRISALLPAKEEMVFSKLVPEVSVISPSSQQDENSAFIVVILIVGFEFPSTRTAIIPHCKTTRLKRTPITPIQEIAIVQLIERRPVIS
jgi:hypothetical protein